MVVSCIHAGDRYIHSKFEKKKVNELVCSKKVLMKLRRVHPCRSQGESRNQGAFTDDIRRNLATSASCSGLQHDGTMHMLPGGAAGSLQGAGSRGVAD